MDFSGDTAMLGAFAGALVLIFTSVVTPVLISLRNQINELRKEVQDCEKHRKEDMLWRAKWEGKVNKLAKRSLVAHVTAEMTPDGLKIIDVTSATCELFEYTPNEMLGRGVEMLIAHVQRDKHSHAANSVSDEILTAEVNHGIGLTKSGKQFPARVKLERITLKGKSVWHAQITDASN